MKIKKELKNYNTFFYLLFAVILVLVGQSFVGESIKNPFSYLFTPTYTAGSNAGQKVSDWNNALINASSYIEEYNSMKDEIARLKAKNAEQILNYEEYLSLKQNSLILNKEYKYLEAKILNNTEDGKIVINRGSEDGVGRGDIVVLGKVYIGTVSDVGLNTSLVRLPLSKSSSFEVIVMPSTVDWSKEEKVDGLIKSTGVVTGDLDKIIIENMGINSNVEEGDLVLIRDDRVGDVLVLGTLVNVSDNPASTYKSGEVIGIFDYYSILTVFVRQNGNN